MQIVWVIRHGSIGSGNSKYWQVHDADSGLVDGVAADGLTISVALAAAAKAAAALSPARRISSMTAVENMNGELLLLLDQA